MKEIPESFYTPYFEMSRPEIFNDPKAFDERLRALEILLPTRTVQRRVEFLHLALFHRMMEFVYASFPRQGI